MSDTIVSNNSSSPDDELSDALSGALPGLVNCSKSPGVIWEPAFPTFEDAQSATAAWAPLRPLAATRRGSGNPGSPVTSSRASFILTVTPGTVAISFSVGDKTDPVVPAHSSGYEADVCEVKDSTAHSTRSRMAAKTPGDADEVQPTAPTDSARRIVVWSPKSRAGFRRLLAELDYTPLLDMCGTRPPVTVTLTYPGDWEVVAPSSKVALRHLDLFLRRWSRQWCTNHPETRKPNSFYRREDAAEWDRRYGSHICADVIVIWKKEFQDRGAPHFHLLVPDPSDNRIEFQEWVSATWAAIVDHPDEQQRRNHELAGTGVDEVVEPGMWTGAAMRNPRTLAFYFLKHGSGGRKEYQHRVPALWLDNEGAGRFWGYRGLKPARAHVELALTHYLFLRRTMRRYATRRVDWYTLPRDVDGVPLGARYPHRVAPVTRIVTILGKVQSREYQLGFDEVHTITCVTRDHKTGELVPTRGRTRRIVRRARSVGGTGHHALNGGWVAFPDAPAIARKLADHAPLDAENPSSEFRQRRLARITELSRQKTEVPGKPATRRPGGETVPA